MTSVLFMDWNKNLNWIYHSLSTDIDIAFSMTPAWVSVYRCMCLSTEYLELVEMLACFGDHGSDERFARFYNDAIQTE